MCQNPALLLTSAAWTEEVDPFLAVTISRGGNGPCRERQVTDCRKVDYFLFFWFVRTADFQKVRYFWFVEFLRTADESQLLLRCFSACRKRTSATPPPPPTIAINRSVQASGGCRGKFTSDGRVLAKVYDTFAKLHCICNLLLIKETHSVGLNAMSRLNVPPPPTPRPPPSVCGHAPPCSWFLLSETDRFCNESQQCHVA